MMIIRGLLMLSLCAGIGASQADSEAPDVHFEKANAMTSVNAVYDDYGGTIWWRGPLVHRNEGDFIRLKFSNISNPDREPAWLVLSDELDRELERIDLTALDGALATARFTAEAVRPSIEAAVKPVKLKVELSEYFTRAIVEPEPLSIVSGNGARWQDAASLANNAVEAPWRSGVVNILFLETMQTCSGFLVAGGNIVTNRHCVRNSKQFRNTNTKCGDVEIQFDYLAPTSRMVRLHCESAKVSAERDIGVLHIKPAELGAISGRHIFKFKASTSFPQEAQMLHHPAGTPMKLSRPCQLVQRVDVNRVNHSCDTVQGSSGGALLDTAGNVIAVQYLGLDMTLAEFQRRTALGEVFYNTAVDGAKVALEFEELK